MAIDGTYEVIANTPLGTQATRLLIKTDGDVITGTGSALGKSYPIENGRAVGNTAAFDIKAETPFGAVKLDFKLTFEGDKVSGEVLTPFGPQNIEGTRVTA